MDKKWKVYRNLLIVWFLTGFWHGASWNYILWGLYYFALLVIEKAFIGDLLKKLPSFVQHMYTLFFVLFGWLLFVFEDLSAGMVWLGNMFGVGTYKFMDMSNVYDLTRNIVFFAVLVVACSSWPRKLFYKLYEKYNAARIGAFAGGVAIMVLCIAYLVDSSFNPFLYFRF